MPVMLRLLFVLLLCCAGAPAKALCISPLCTCTVTTTPVIFGDYNPFSATDRTGTGSVSVKCGGVVGLLIPYQIDINKGPGAGYPRRRMSAGTNKLAYDLFSDPGYGAPWGDGVGVYVPVLGNIGLDLAGLAPAVVHTVYGVLPARQTAAIPGSYADTVMVTVTYQ